MPPSPRSSKTRRTLVAVGASAAAHLAFLTLLLLSIDRSSPMREPPAIMVSLRPWVFPPAPRVRPAVKPASPARMKPPVAAPPPAAVPRMVTSPSGPLPPATIDPQLGAEAAALRALGDTVRCAHQDPSEMDAAQRARCAQIARDYAKGARAYAALPADPAKAAALEKAARVNEAWRRYRGSTRMDDYPGLRTLFGHDADPCPPGPECWARAP